VIRATFDSNIYISALQFHGVGLRLLYIAQAGMIRMDTSNAIIEETIGVLRDKFEWAGYRLHFAQAALLKLAYRVTPVESLRIADDPDDDRIIECAVTAGSDFIVTFDKDLLRLGEYRGIKIVQAAEFLRSGIAG
jgi:putative PIN family toxin of toxin-antitoxin system